MPCIEPLSPARAAVTDTVEGAPGRKATTFDRWVQENVGAFIDSSRNSQSCATMTPYNDRDARSEPVTGVAFYCIRCPAWFPGNPVQGSVLIVPTLPNRNWPADSRQRVLAHRVPT